MTLRWTAAAALSALAVLALVVQAPVAAAPELANVREAAAEGDPEALFELGAAYEEGAGVAHDLGLAAHWFALAAARGHRVAQYRLGLLHLAGAGAKKDPIEAYRWLALAAQDDGETAVLAEALREVAAGEVPEEDLEQVRAEVARFAPESGPVSVPAPSEAVAALPDAPQLAATLAEQLRRTGCGEPGLAENGERGVKVTAFVPKELDRSLLDSAIRALAEARPLTLDLVEIEAGLCGVIELLEANRSRLAPLDGVVLRNGQGVATGRFTDGDQLIVEVPSQPEDGYVWVDYFVHDGQVLHMLPSPTLPDNAAPGGERLVLGRPDGKGGEWVIGPPFGNDLLVIFATDRPLYAGDRPQLESIAAYLSFLRSRFARMAPGETIRVASRLVRTEEG